MTTIKEFCPGLWLTDLVLAEFDVRGKVIVGEERVVVWDTLSHPRDMEPILPLIEGKQLIIVYTHADWDHVWGTDGLPYGHASIIGHTMCRERFSGDVPRYLAGRQKAQPGQWDEVVLVPPNVSFRGELDLDLGGVTLALHYLPGHTLDCLVGFLPEWGILLAGDTVETPLPVVNDVSPVDRWLVALEQWAHNIRVQTVIPAHGPIGGRELIRHNIDYLQRLAAGEPIDLPDSLTEFYIETHQANLRHVQNKA
jgi:glyoxylase-like metal-dependent hydrolase (beta-lactamase superfamily II)